MFLDLFKILFILNILRGLDLKPDTRRPKSPLNRYTLLIHKIRKKTKLPPTVTGIITQNVFLPHNEMRHPPLSGKDTTTR
jgi:hypothetical protein